MLRMLQASIEQLHGNTKRNICKKKNGSLAAPGFREISSRENQ
jgi:hypothetical protein